MAKRISLNPYIAGRALSEPQSFFGREDILEDVERNLRQRNNNSIVLYGQRRIGKTSILYQLQHNLPNPPFFPVHFDLMERAKVSISQILYDLAQEIAFAVGFSMPKKEVFEQNPDNFRRVFLPQLYRELGSDHYLVILFDEFDVLDTQHADEPGTASREFLPYLRRLLNNEPQLKFVFVIGRRMEDLSANFSATFKASIAQPIALLSETSVRKLILRAEEQGSIKYEEAAIERIISLTHCHPYLTQLSCQIIFDNMMDNNGTEQVPLVTVRDVEAAVPKILESGQNALVWIWNGLPPAEQVIFSAIAQQTAEGSILNEDDLQMILQSAGIRMLVKELNLAPRSMVEWGMLEEVDGGYRVYVELIRRWVAENYPLSRVKDELDRINPLAETLYQNALNYQRGQNYERAIDQLQQVKENNPNHSEGRLLLGNIYREQGELEKAIVEYEAGYELDDRLFRFELIETLLAQGQALEATNNESEALEAYARVLDIQPGEQDAEKRRVAIWIRRGDNALKTKQYDDAIEAYGQAGLEEKLETTRSLKHKDQVDTKAKLVTEHESREEWPQAILFYQELVVLEPEQERWQAGVVRAEGAQWLVEQYELATQAVDEENWPQAVTNYQNLLARGPNNGLWQAELSQAQEEQWLTEQYELAAQALKKQDWLIAQNLLLQIVGIRPNYRDTAQLLQQVQEQKIGIFTWWTALPRPLKQRVVGSTALLIATLFFLVFIVFSQPSLQSISDSNDAAVIALQGTRRFNGYVFATQTRVAVPTATNTPLPTPTFSPEDFKDLPPINIENAKELAELTQLGKGPVETMSYSPNSNLLAIASSYGVYVYNAQTFEQIWFIPHDFPVSIMAFSPNGQILATSSEDDTIRLWQISDGSLINTLEGHNGNVTSVAFSPDGRILASGSRDDTVRLWQISDGSLINTLEGHTNDVTSVAFSPDGQILASGSWDDTVRLWQVSDGTLLNTLEGHTNDVNNVAFSPDGQILASSSSDESIRLWRVLDGLLINTFKGHNGKVKSMSMAFSPDGQILAYASWDSQAKVTLRQVSDGSLINTLEGHSDGVHHVAFSPNGQILATSSKDGTVRLWQVSDGSLISTLEGDKHRFSFFVAASVAFSSDREILTSGIPENLVRLWQISDGSLINTLAEHNDKITSIAFSPDGQILASSSADDAARLWQISDGSLINTLEGHKGYVTNVAFSPDGQVLASGSGTDASVRLWQVSNGSLINTLEGHDVNVSSVAFSPDGQILASGARDDTVRLWQVSANSLINILEGHDDNINSVAFSPDGQILATSSEDDTVRLWQVSDGSLINTLRGHTNSVNSVAFSPDGQILASGSSDDTVRLWQVSDGSLINTLEGHTNSVNSVAFSPDGQILASGSGDDTVRLWRVSDNSLINTLEEHTNSVTSVAFSPDGQILASGSSDGLIRLWGSANQR